MGSRQWAGRHQLWQVNPHFHYRVDQRDQGPIGSLRWCCWRGKRRGTKHSRGTPAGDKRGLMKGLRRLIGSQLGKRLTGICRSCHLIVVVQSPPQWGWVEMAGQISRGVRPKGRPHCLGLFVRWAAR